MFADPCPPEKGLVYFDKELSKCILNKLASARRVLDTVTK